MALQIKEKVLTQWPYSPDDETLKMVFPAMAVLVFVGAIQTVIVLTG